MFLRESSSTHVRVADGFPAQDGAGPPVERGDDEPGGLAGAEQGVVVVVGVHDHEGGGAVDVCKS